MFLEKIGIKLLLTKTKKLRTKTDNCSLEIFLAIYLYGDCVDIVVVVFGYGYSGIRVFGQIHGS